MLFIKNI